METLRNHDIHIKTVKRLDPQQNQSQTYSCAVLIVRAGEELSTASFVFLFAANSGHRGSRGKVPNGFVNSQSWWKSEQSARLNGQWVAGDVGDRGQWRKGGWGGGQTERSPQCQLRRWGQDHQKQLFLHSYWRKEEDADTVSSWCNHSCPKNHHVYCCLVQYIH